MSKSNSKKNNCNKESENDNSIGAINLVDDISIERKKMSDDSQKEYNFMGTLNNWTTPDEQEAKVKEIEKATKIEVNHVKEAENHNHGQWDRK